MNVMNVKLDRRRLHRVNIEIYFDVEQGIKCTPSFIASPYVYSFPSYGKLHRNGSSLVGSLEEVSSQVSDLDPKSQIKTFVK